jgi:hypothetical protein
MISREEKHSIQKQVSLLRLSRSSFYYRLRAVSETDLKLMRQIDQLHLEYPIEFFNQQRPHSNLNRQTPGQVYFNRLPETLEA